MTTPSQSRLARFARERTWLWKHLALRSRAFKLIKLVTLTAGGTWAFYEMREPCLDKNVAISTPQKTRGGLAGLQFAGDRATAARVIDNYRTNCPGGLERARHN